MAQSGRLESNQIIVELAQQMLPGAVVYRLCAECMCEKHWTALCRQFAMYSRSNFYSSKHRLLVGVTCSSLVHCCCSDCWLVALPAVRVFLSGLMLVVAVHKPGSAWGVLNGFCTAVEAAYPGSILQHMARYPSGWPVGSGGSCHESCCQQWRQ